ncbi:hypothetical protein A8C56_03685 [Niabella ginsenosidivorans]|uniref:Uncharacterized protein n=1 Tax=Niabella ginsenosidivorans TaxID=1176587 RepID=A0A1A9I0E3_9BACT|nr:hypothetical protein A8C56_03685 [Niabella ginsenosidivorans]
MKSWWLLKEASLPEPVIAGLTKKECQPEPLIKAKSSESSDEAMTIILTGHPKDAFPDLFRDLFLLQGPD